MARPRADGDGTGQLDPAFYDLLASEARLTSLFVIAKGDARQLVYYWYQERGRVIADDSMKLASLFWDRATRSRTDGALVRFTLPVVRGDEAKAEASFHDLAMRLVPLLPSYVPN